MAAVVVARRGRRRARPRQAAVPALGPRLQFARAALLGMFVISVSLLFELLVVSGLQQRAAQQRAYDALRSDLATGTAPIGPTDADGRVLASGAPVAYLEVPAIGLRQVIVEGSAPSSLFNGPGHRRDTPLPGQFGTSIVLGRRAAFGGPFSRIHDLRAGDLIHVTTGQGEFDYRVTGIRKDGDRIPEPADAEAGRLVLVTATGRPFMPAGVLRVDAVLEGQAVGGATRLISASSLPPREQAMGADASTLWALALWLQALTVLVVTAVWAWHRWGRVKTWVVFVPPLLLVGLSMSGEAARLMPNLL